jgi:hypothetical protein
LLPKWFHTTKQPLIAINVWLRQYNRVRPHHALNMEPAVPKNLIRE